MEELFAKMGPIPMATGPLVGTFFESLFLIFIFFIVDTTGS
jgi:hypothetical protein